MPETITDTQKMAAAGYEAGANAAAWMFNGAVSADYARRIFHGIEDGDPEIMDSLPSSPLSGEWADGMTEQDAFESADVWDEDEDSRDDLLRAFEDGYSAGAQDEASILGWFYSGEYLTPDKAKEMDKPTARRIRDAAERYAQDYS